MKGGQSETEPIGPATSKMWKQIIAFGPNGAIRAFESALGMWESAPLIDPPGIPDDTQPSRRLTSLRGHCGPFSLLKGPAKIKRKSLRRRVRLAPLGSHNHSRRF